MSDHKVIETFYSKHSRYDVVEVSNRGIFIHTQYYIYKNGEHHSGGYDDLKDAIRAAKTESGN